MKNNDHNIYLFSYYLFIYLSIGAGDWIQALSLLGKSSMTEWKAMHFDENYKSVNPTIPVNPKCKQKNLKKITLRLTIIKLLHIFKTLKNTANQNSMLRKNI
jgi:hypothetical protein